FVHSVASRAVATDPCAVCLDGDWRPHGFGGRRRERLGQGKGGRIAKVNRIPTVLSIAFDRRRLHRLIQGWGLPFRRFAPAEPPGGSAAALRRARERRACHNVKKPPAPAGGEPRKEGGCSKC